MRIAALASHGGSILQAVIDACRQLWEDGADATKIAGMAVTTQRATMVNLGTDGEPVRPAITWLDQRQCSEPPKLGGK